MDKIRVMLVDDQMLLREGLKTIINLQEDMEVVTEAENGKSAVDQMKEWQPDVILMDIRMPVLNGVEAAAVIKRSWPKTAIIILTTFDDDDYVIEALSNGADGYLLKDIDGEHLIQSIRDAHHGQMLLPGRIAGKLAVRLAGMKYHAPVAHSLLTERERELGLLMAEGLSNRQIARKLFLSEGTVKNYISEIYGKLGTNNRVQAGMLLSRMFDSD